jgi:hypothetical protein
VYEWEYHEKLWKIGLKTNLAINMTDKVTNSVEGIEEIFELRNLSIFCSKYTYNILFESRKQINYSMNQGVRLQRSSLSREQANNGKLVSKCRSESKHEAKHTRVNARKGLGLIK